MNRKIIKGFVHQDYDTKTGKLVCQEFTPLIGNKNDYACTWEDSETGDRIKTPSDLEQSPISLQMEQPE